MKIRACFLLIYCLALAVCKANMTNSLSDSAIAVTIPYDSYDGADHHDKFDVLITNVSNKPVRLWQEWNSWGYYCLQIEIVTRNGTRHLLKKKPTGFTRNFPEFIELPTGQSVVWHVDLNPTEWEDLSWFPKYMSVRAKIRAVFKIEKTGTGPGDAFDTDHWGIWTGQAVSPSYDFTLYGPWQE
jgi:hypothetical protein